MAEGLEAVCETLLAGAVHHSEATAVWAAVAVEEAELEKVVHAASISAASVDGPSREATELSGVKYGRL